MVPSENYRRKEIMYPIDKGLYKEIAELLPDEVCKRTGCRIDKDDGALVLSAWGDVYKVHPQRQDIQCLRGENPGPHSYFSVFLVHYLIGVPDKDPDGEWISEKDIPGGPTFFRGPHQIPTGLISARYGNNVHAFSAICQQL
jgi:hypothetical protein